MRASRVSRLVAEARFVLHGTVVAVGESAVAGIPPSDRTLNLRVDSVVQAPDSERPAVGQVVTVEMSSAVTNEVGDTLTVFANAVTFGATIGLVEVASDGGDLATLAGQIDDGNHRARATAVATRIEAADLVVSGQVVALAPVDAGDTPRLSEHDPHWWTATIAVDEVFKGSGRTRTVQVQYPTTRDVAWVDAPRFEAGQRGVFMLQRGAVPTVPRTALTALDVLDVQGPEERAAVASMVEGDS